jgi:hypothetical protein
MLNIEIAVYLRKYPSIYAYMEELWTRTKWLITANIRVENKIRIAKNETGV